MNRHEYTEMQVDLVQNGEIKGFEANDKIVGFTYAEKGYAWDYYRAAQKRFVEDNLISRGKANDRLHGFRDYIRLNR